MTPGPWPAGASEPGVGEDCAWMAVAAAAVNRATVSEASFLEENMMGSLEWNEVESTSSDLAVEARMNGVNRGGSSTFGSVVAAPALRSRTRTIRAAGSEPCRELSFICVMQRLSDEIAATETAIDRAGPAGA